MKVAVPPCGALFAKAPFHRFKDFIDLSKSRFDVLNALLDELDFHYSLVQFGENRHFFLSGQSKEKPSIVLAAHYDSVPGSPGANDNASSVFLLIAAALELKKMPNQSWLIIFTDKEELTSGESLCAQGSYLLARGLKNIDIAEADFFVFDACGRGDTLIISTATDNLIRGETGIGAAQLQETLRRLHTKAQAAADRIFGTKHFSMPTPFSDNAGFLRAGLAAGTITLLPEKEALDFARMSRVNSDYAEALVNSKFSASVDAAHIPRTWHLINSPDDTIEHLNLEIFPKMIKFAIRLATQR
ncbi:MAG: Zn-dependent exopeptidase M28 [Spirochaetaceae bacterium]|jgi:acetylornithine deacetylase/succinyl-diaminopimelate desuccinylase-like protein|nr:Zn-dependent exopeptidase M28 [Spirochaetaceae bacterium]